MSIRISQKISRDKGKIWYTIEWGKATYQRKATGVFTYVKCRSKSALDATLLPSVYASNLFLKSIYVHFGLKSQHYEAGDFRFVVKNRLSKFIKHPPEVGDFRSISICIDQPTLVEMAEHYKYDVYSARDYDNVFSLKPNLLFKNYIDSLMPYLEHGDEISSDLLKAKINEAVLIFLSANPYLKNVQFDFSEPGKIDLQGYMEQHYQYNGDLQHFAYLTGRSLSTFKRDFEKIYHTTPSKWLIKKSWSIRILR